MLKATLQAEYLELKQQKNRNAWWAVAVFLGMLAIRPLLGAASVGQYSGSNEGLMITSSFVLIGAFIFLLVRIFRISKRQRQILAELNVHGENTPGSRA